MAAQVRIGQPRASDGRVCRRLDWRPSSTPWPATAGSCCEPRWRPLSSRWRDARGQDAFQDFRKRVNETARRGRCRHLRRCGGRAHRDRPPGGPEGRTAASSSSARSTSRSSAVRCSLEELTRRERARGDRPPRTAAAQFEVVHAHGDYDVEVDTGAHTAAACARQIVGDCRRRDQPVPYDVTTRRMGLRHRTGTRAPASYLVWSWRATFLIFSATLLVRACEGV